MGNVEVKTIEITDTTANARLRMLEEHLRDGWSIVYVYKNHSVQMETVVISRKISWWRLLFQNSLPLATVGVAQGEAVFRT